MSISQGRLKKHIKAKAHLFLIQSASDFRSCLAKELEGYGIAFEEQDAGFYVQLKLGDMYRLALCLRTASYIHLVLKPGRSGSNEELFNTLSKIDWNLYIKNNSSVAVKSRVRKSRIQHEGAVKDIASRVLSAKGYRDDNQDEAQQITLVLQENQLEVRINAVGIHLHKRGYRLSQGPAPIRETSAAALLQWAFSQVVTPESSLRILDPMCGSGTMLYEAAGLFYPRFISGARTYSFQDWPCFLEQTFSYLKRSIQGSPVQIECFGFDTDNKVIEKAESINQSLLSSIIADHLPAFSFENRNIFTDQGYPEVDIVVLNPPYGLRLKVDDQAYYRRLFHVITQKCRAKAYMFLIPSEYCSQLPEPDHMFSFSNGGIHMKSLLFLRK